jgi:hypothetical protein
VTSGQIGRVALHDGCPSAYRLGVGAMRVRAGGWRTRVGILLAIAGALLVGCTGLVGCTTPQPVRSPAAPELSGPTATATVLAPDAPLSLAAATSAALYRSAPVVVLAGAGDPDGQAGAASAAVALGAPMLLTPAADADPRDASAVTDEVRRLGPEALLAVGKTAQDWGTQNAGGVRVVPAAPAALAGVVKVDVGQARAVDAGDLTGAAAGLDRGRPELLTVPGAPAAPATEDVADGTPDLPASTPAEPVRGLVVLARAGADQVAAAATARAAGARVHVLPTPDPRGSRDLVTELSGAPDDKVMALGSAFGTVETLQQRLAVARTGVQLPGGGQLAFPGRRMVALYGTPGTPALGSLGEQGVDGSVARVKDLVGQYQQNSDVPVVPAFEIITTVAAGQPGVDGNFSNEVEIAKIRPYVDAAKAAGVYVVLDLQPGRTDFLTQARRYEELLVEPHVGIALDPEWRLQPGQVHRVQIGSVNVDEINATGDWLAGLVRDRALPQKLLLLHQFRTSMIVGRERLDTGHDELATMVHADGFGTQEMKRDTWNALRANSPNVFWGWKNFIDEDRPMLDPAQTLQVSGDIVFVSYQ